MLQKITNVYVYRKYNNICCNEELRSFLFIYETTMQYV